MATLALLLLLGAAAVPLALAAFTAWTARRVEAALPPLGRFVDVDGARLQVVERGAGSVTLLLLHGLGGHVRHWTYALADRLADEFHVVVLERPGSGHSTRPRDAAAGPRAQAETVAAAIRAMGLDRPVLVGHSLGGAVALATAVAHPELVRALALIAPVTLPQAAPPAVLRALAVRGPLARRLIAWTLATPLAIRRRDEALAAIFGPDAVPRDYGTAGGGLLGLRPRAFESASADLVALGRDMPALVRRYGTLPVPVSVLYGRDDRLLDPALHGEGLRAHLPGVHVELVAGGHMLPITAPERVAAFVRAAARRAARAS